jgi:hypothetical protein
MTIKIEIRSRKLGRTVRFVARESGYVFVDPTAASWGRQLFDQRGDAVLARSKEELQRVARRWIDQQVVI